jgi:hypothetical protein
MKAGLFWRSNMTKKNTTPEIVTSGVEETVPTASEPRTKPVHKIFDGNIRAAIWANKTKQGATLYSATFSRSYKIGEKEFGDSASFGKRDLLTLAKLIDAVHSWMASQYAQKSA